MPKTTTPDGRMPSEVRDRRLEIRRVVLPALPDDQVLRAPADEQLAVGEVAEVAGVEPAVPQRLGRRAPGPRSSRPSPRGRARRSGRRAAPAGAVRHRPRSGSSCSGKRTAAADEADRRRSAIADRTRPRDSRTSRPGSTRVHLEPRDGRRRRPASVRPGRSSARSSTRWKPAGAKRSAKARSVSARIGSAPQPATRQLDRSSASICDGLTRRRHSS